MPSPQSWSRSTKTNFSNLSEINALLSGKHWESSKISYSFPEVNSTWSTNLSAGYGPSYSNNEPWHSDFQPLQDTDRTHFISALQQWENVANIDYVEIKETSNSVGDIRAAYTGNETLVRVQAWSYEPANAAYAGDIWFNNNGSSSTEYWRPGSYEFMTVVHELGHAVGLKHPFESSGISTTRLPTSLDSRSYTIMSYSAQPGAKDTYFSYEPTSLMMLDIAAIQHIYGANYEYNSGNDIYQYSDETPYHQTIWDGGGTDAIQYDGNLESILDLRQEHGSRIGQAVYIEGATSQVQQTAENIWIARGVDIENASGGKNNDQLIGNKLGNYLQGHAGDDNITGGGGNDTINGGAGLDKAHYSLAYENYTIIPDEEGYITQANAGTDGVDIIREVERIVFTDTKLALDINGHAGEVSKILGAVFGSDAVEDKQLVGIGLQRLDSSTSYTELIQQALNAKLGKGFSDQAEIQLLYQNILSTQPSQDELNYWSNTLNNGQFTQTSLAIMAANLDLNMQNINLIGLSQTGLEYL